MFRKLCGDPALKNVVLVTNMWKEDARNVNEAREKELSTKFFRPALDKDAQMVRHNNTSQSAHDIIRRIAANHPTALQIQRELVRQRKDIVNTVVGKTIVQELNEQIRRHQAELREVREETKQALKENGEQTRQELEEEARRLQERMEAVTKKSRGMSTSYVAEKRRMEAKLEGTRRGVQKRERDEANHTHRPQAETNVSAADRVRPEHQMKRPHDLTGILPKIPADEPPHHATPQHTRGAKLVSHRKQSLSSIPRRTFDPRIPSPSTL